MHGGMIASSPPARRLATVRNARRRRVRTWLAMCADRTVRLRVLMLAALVLALIASLGAIIATAFAPDEPEGAAASALWAEASPQAAAALPGSPENLAPSGQPAPPPIEGAAARARNAGTPFAPRGPAAPPFRFAGSAQDHARARTCLAVAMLYEAGQDAIGQLAVGQVILNRARHPAFPGSVCGVVLQGSERTAGCQFTFTCDGSLARRYPAGAIAAALRHADLMLDGLVFAGVGLATHYHTQDVHPWWSSRLEKIAQVGPHLFLRWHGIWGSRLAIGRRAPQAEPGSGRLASVLPATLPPPTATAADAAPAPAPAPDVGARPTAAQGQTISPRLDAGHAHALTGNAAAVGLPPARSVRYPDAIKAGEVRPATRAASSLPGNMRLARAHAEHGLFHVIAPSRPGGPEQQAAAEILCEGRRPCEVYGWSDEAAVPRGATITPVQRKEATFSVLMRSWGRRVPGELEKMP